VKRKQSSIIEENRSDHVKKEREIHI